MKKKEPAAVEKFKPYPFATLIKMEGAAQPIRTLALSLSTLGMQVKLTQPQHFRVGSKVEIEFEVPTLDHRVACQVTIVKTYDTHKASAGQNSGKEYMLELHFVSLSDKHREVIEKFVAKLGKKK